MPKRLSVSFLVTIPSDPFDAAAVYQQLQPSWTALLDALKATGAEFHSNISETEVRAKRAPRKPRLTTVPPAPEAA